MFIWLAEHASFVYAAILVAAVAVGMQYWLQRRVKHLVLLIGLLILLVGISVLLRLVPTDRKQINDNLQAMSQAIMDGDAKRLFRFVSKDFEYQGHTGEQLYGRIDRTLKQHRVKFLKIWDIDVRPEGHRAKVDFYFRVDGEGEFFARGKSEFGREQNVWKMRTIQVFTVAGDNEMALPLAP